VFSLHGAVQCLNCVYGSVQSALLASATLTEGAEMRKAGTRSQGKHTLASSVLSSRVNGLDTAGADGDKMRDLLPRSTLVNAEPKTSAEACPLAFEHTPPRFARAIDSTQRSGWVFDAPGWG
jgi:hypothetical protein